jgi:hypothetical protein
LCLVRFLRLGAFLCLCLVRFLRLVPRINAEFWPLVAVMSAYRSNVSARRVALRGHTLSSGRRGAASASCGARVHHGVPGLGKFRALGKSQCPMDPPFLPDAQILPDKLPSC